MTYFTKFPILAYDSLGKDEFKLTPNLLKRVGARSNALVNSTMLVKYHIRTGETPESLAYDFYGDTRLHWVILITNNITDRFHGWPLTERQFQNFVNDKYSNPNATHHYEISQTSGDDAIKIDIGTDNTDYPSATAITNYEHELDLQEKLSLISILKEEFLQQFTDEFNSIMQFG